MSECLFCKLPNFQIIDESSYCLAFRDGFPVTEFHTLIIPRRHCDTYFDLYSNEVLDIHQMINRQRANIVELDTDVTGFNIGMNCGATAGQTVFHCHIHLIPRRDGDVKNPSGGIRHTIPNKGNYINLHNLPLSA